MGKANPPLCRENPLYFMRSQQRVPGQLGVSPLGNDNGPTSITDTAVRLLPISMVAFRHLTDLLRDILG